MHGLVLWHDDDHDNSVTEDGRLAEEDVGRGEMGDGRMVRAVEGRSQASTAGLAGPARSQVSL